MLIFGGSLGALHIDRAAVGACRILAGRSDLQVLLITGPAHLPAVDRALATFGAGAHTLTSAFPGLYLFDALSAQSIALNNSSTLDLSSVQFGSGGNRQQQQQFDQQEQFRQFQQRLQELQNQQNQQRGRRRP